MSRPAHTPADTHTALSAHVPAVPPPPSPRVSTPRARKPWAAAAWLYAAGALVLLSAVYRLYAMLTFDPTLPVAAIDEVTPHYVAHTTTVVPHLVFGIVFTVTGPLQFWTALRIARPRLHKLSGYAYVLSAVITGASALYMNHAFPPVGGMLKYTSNAIFGAGLLLAVLAAMAAVFRGDIKSHRAWMARSFAMGLGVSTQRLYFIVPALIMGDLSDLTIGIGVWVCWLFNLAVAEWLLRRRGPTRARR